MPATNARASTRLLGRRKKQLAAARDAAATARDAMTQALYDMESRRRGMAIRAEFAALDGSAEGRRLQTEFATLRETLDDLSQAYLTVLAGHEMGDTVTRLRGAEAACYAFRERLLAASADLADFEQRSAAQVARVEARFARSLEAMRTAADEIAAARRAVESAAAAGLHSARAISALEDAERSLAEAHAAADRYDDIDRVATRTESAVASAREASRIASELPALRERVSTRLASIRTHLQAVEGRVGPVEETLSQLRRRYTYAAFEDLADFPSRLAAQIELARRAIEEAARSAESQDWEAAGDALSRAAAALSAGHTTAQTVLDRASRLASVAADPQAPLERARFAVRDAQRLLMSRGAAPPAGFVRELDGLAARLDAAAGMLSGTHPDYWAYLQALDSVRDGARDAVTRIRQWAASQH